VETDPKTTSGGTDDLLEASLDAAELGDPTESMLLLDQAQGGDQDALSALLERYQERLRRIVSIRLSSDLRSCVESMDIVQDVFAAAAQHLDTLTADQPASIIQWLSRIAENTMTSTWRRQYAQKRDRHREVDLTGAARTAAAAGEQPSELAARRELEDLVDEAMTELPPDDREVIMLRTYYGGSWDFVAKQLGRPGADAARQLHRRARIRLGRMLRKKMGTDTENGDEPV
jgi:RNA polymerase sigma-70 factor (ECF subfamily)